MAVTSIVRMGVPNWPPESVSYISPIMCKPDAYTANAAFFCMSGFSPQSAGESWAKCAWVSWSYVTGRVWWCCWSCVSLPGVIRFPTSSCPSRPATWATASHREPGSFPSSASQTLWPGCCWGLLLTYSGNMWVARKKTRRVKHKHTHTCITYRYTQTHTGRCTDIHTSWRVSTMC